MCLSRMHSSQDTAITTLDKYGILYDVDKSAAGVGPGRRRQFLDPYGFRLTTMF
jgi:hypothetical protein